MRVVMISTDRKIFEEGSAVRARMLEYGAIFGELHVIVLSRHEHKIRDVERLSKNVFAYPTNSSGKLAMVRDAVRIGKAIIKHDFEAKGSQTVVTSQDPFETGWVGWRLARRTDVPFQVQIHTDFLSPYFGRQSFMNSLRVYLASFILPRAEGVRVVSEKIQQSMIERYVRLPQRIDVVPVFVDINKIRQTPRNENLRRRYSRFRKIVLMASRITEEKNISLALRAFAEVVIKHPEAGLLIVGDGPECYTLERLAQELGIRSRVVFEPWRNDVVSLMVAADLYLLTSNYEGYGMALVEATAAGCPVVSTEVGISEKLLSPDARVSVNDKNGLAKAVTLMLENNERRGAILRYAKEHLPRVVSKNKEDHLQAIRRTLEQLISH